MKNKILKELKNNSFTIETQSGENTSVIDELLFEDLSESISKILQWRDLIKSYDVPELYQTITKSKELNDSLHTLIGKVWNKAYITALQNQSYTNEGGR